MTRLAFPLDQVAALAAASRAAPEREPTWGQRCDPRYAKPGAGAPAGELGELTDDQLDGAAVPAGLWLCKDEGIYLMSNGLTADGRVDLDPVYARGYGPSADWDAVREAAGGDDFCEFLPASWVDDARRAGDDVFVLSLTPKSVRLMLPRRAPKEA